MNTQTYGIERTFPNGHTVKVKSHKGLISFTTREQAEKALVEIQRKWAAVGYQFAVAVYPNDAYNESNGFVLGPHKL